MSQEITQADAEESVAKAAKKRQKAEGELGRTRGVVVQLRPTTEQRGVFKNACRMRRRVKHYLIRLDRLRLNSALWKACVEHAQVHGSTPEEVRKLWADQETRKHLKVAGFSYTVAQADPYRETTKWVNQRKRQWMLAPPQQARNGACQDHRAAVSNFFNSLKGIRKGPRIGPPKFESRFGKPRFTVQAQGCKFGKTGIQLPKIGTVRTTEDVTKRFHGGRPTMVTTWEKNDRWYATVRVSEMAPPCAPNNRDQGSVGVDLNTGDHGIVLSTGLRFPVPPRLEELDKEIRSHQRKHRHKVKPDHKKKQRPSRQWITQNRTLKKLHQEVARVRENWLHGVTTWLANHYRVVVIEDLNVSGMTSSAKGTTEEPGKNVSQKSGLNRKILQASFGMIRQMLAYKMPQSGGLLVVIDRWFPSSQLCCRCGTKHPKMKSLDQRVMACHACGLVEDRDKNSARNLRRAYEDSIAAAAAKENVGGESPPWTGTPLMGSDMLEIKWPGKTRRVESAGKKRKRTETGTQYSGDLGQLGGASSS